jgi:hypothetical protein
MTEARCINCAHMSSWGDEGLYYLCSAWGWLCRRKRLSGWDCSFFCPAVTEDTILEAECNANAGRREKEHDD